MASCLSPVNLSAPMSSFFIKPTDSQGARYLPFADALAAAVSTVTRQPRGPPAPTSPVKAKAKPAPVTVFPAPSSWRDRAVAGPAEMPKTPKSSKSSAKSSSRSPKSRGKGKGSRRTSERSPSVYSAKSSSESEIPAPYVEEEPISPASRVYDITFLLCLSTSPLVGVTETERTHMEDLVYNHTWRRGPHQSDSESRSSSRSSSPTPSGLRSRSVSPAASVSSQRLRQGGQGHRRTRSKLCNSTMGDEATADL